MTLYHRRLHSFPTRRSSDLLETENMPILSTLRGWKYGFNSPFKAEVYFVSTRQWTDLKWGTRSEEHTSELQSQSNLVCRLLLEKKKERSYALFWLTKYQS